MCFFDVFIDNISLIFTFLVAAQLCQNRVCRNTVTLNNFTKQFQKYSFGN